MIEEVETGKMLELENDFNCHSSTQNLTEILVPYNKLYSHEIN